jgi:hypothetical protein
MQRRGSLPGYVVREPPPSENATEETQVLATEEPKSVEVVELARFRAVGDRMVSVSTSKATRADGSRTMVCVIRARRGNLQWSFAIGRGGIVLLQRALAQAFAALVDHESKNPRSTQRRTR